MLWPNHSGRTTKLYNIDSHLTSFIHNINNETAQFHFWEYVNRNQTYMYIGFSPALHLQCMSTLHLQVGPIVRPYYGNRLTKTDFRFRFLTDEILEKSAGLCEAQTTITEELFLVKNPKGDPSYCLKLLHIPNRGKPHIYNLSVLEDYLINELELPHGLITVRTRIHSQEAWQACK
jgi:hypothetical protein